MPEFAPAVFDKWPLTGFVSRGVVRRGVDVAAALISLVIFTADAPVATVS